MRFYRAKRRELLFEVLDKFPKLSNRGTAFLLHHRYPEFFPDIESARSLVRSYRGANGNACRTNLTNKKYYR